jgi:hypothetical protein
LAWFAFMRGEWEQAVAVIRRPLPWTAEVWFLWVLMTVPMGVAIMAYTAGRARSTNVAAVLATAVVWLVLTVPMGAYSLAQAVPMRVIVLDSSVNLVGLAAASIAGAWSQREAQLGGHN